MVFIKGAKRYKCKQCSITFNDFTGTAISGIKKVDKFQEYIKLTLESISIRKAAKKLKISTNTVFDWRHKILTSLSMINGNSFVGIVECDDKQFKINKKGNRRLDRKTKRGISNDKLSVMVATDRKGNSLMKITKMGRIDSDSVEKTIGRL